MTVAFIKGTTVAYSANSSPQSFSTIPEVRSITGLGKTNPLVEATSFDSTAREYIAGLADGQEITIECNYLPGNTVQDAVVAEVNAGTNCLLRVTVTDATQSPNKTDQFDFTVTPLSWVVEPSFDDINIMTFVVKISGDITIS